jgi:uncharacterized protein (TIGR03083 family)
VDEVTTRAHNIPQTPRDDAARTATAELHSELDLLDSLEEHDWARPTYCEGWNVRAVTAHLVGQYEEFANPLLLFRRLRSGHRRYPQMSRLDAHNEMQIENLAGLQVPALIQRLRDKGRRSIRSRRRIPSFMRAIHTGRLFPEEALSDDRLGYMADVVGTRDAWMHRLDIARATNRPFVLGAHDREIVAQVVRDLDRSWTGPAIRLVLTGDAGGEWLIGGADAESRVEADAVAYMLLVSGRDDAFTPSYEGAEEVGRAATTARVVF